MTETSAEASSDDFLQEFDLSEEEYEQERSMHPVTESSDNNNNNNNNNAPEDLYTSLFDMSTVEGVDTKGTIIQSEMITVPRIVLGSGKTISFTEDTMMSYSEVEVSQRNKIIRTSMSDHALILPLRKGCGHDKSFTDHYMIPSLRLNVKEDKEYIEPVRDREKIWTLDSQRDMLTGETPEATLKEKRALKLGIYPKLPPNPVLQWSPTLQTLLRKRRITRTAIVISDTHCFVDIYGIGVSGRVLAPGASTSRMLLIEAYSVWDSTKYTMQVAVPLLKSLLLGQEHLFLPGKKMELMKAIVLLLYFEYTITYEEEQILVPASLEGTSVGTRSEGGNSNSRRNSRMSVGSSITCNSNSSKNNQEDNTNTNTKLNDHDHIHDNNNENENENENHNSSNTDDEGEEEGGADTYSTLEPSLSSVLSPLAGSNKRRGSSSSSTSRSSTGSRPGSRTRSTSSRSRSRPGSGSVRGSSGPREGGGDGDGEDEDEYDDDPSAPQSTVVTHTYRVTHLDKFRLPDTFPQNIADIIRVNSTKPELLDMNCPKLIQHLKISPVIRENGPVVRRREAEEKARQDALEEERKRREWAAIPKRCKGLFAHACRRKYGKWLMMSLYRMPKKPTILVVKGFCPIECVSIPHFLDLKQLGKMFGVKTPPLMWTNQTISQVVKSIGKQLEVGEGDERLALLIRHPISAGPSIQLSHHKSCIGFANRRSIPLTRKTYLPARDPIIPNIPLYEERQYSSHVPKIGKHSRKQRRLYTGDTPHNHMTHRRDIGKKGLRITQRGKKIGHAYGIYSLYLTSKMITSPIGTFEEIEKEVDDKKYGNQVIPSHLAPGFKISVEIYFPVNPTYSALKGGASLPFGDNVSSAPVVLKLVFTRRDLCRLVTDKALLRYCFRIGHGFSYEQASVEEVEEMELKWIELMNVVFRRCRWRQGHRPEALDLEPSSLELSEDDASVCASSDKDKNKNNTNDKDLEKNKNLEKNISTPTPSPPVTINSEEQLLSYYSKVDKAMQMMSGYALDISAQQLITDPTKMITPLPAMKGPPLTSDQLVDAFADDYVGDDVDFSSITESVSAPKEVAAVTEVVEDVKEEEKEEEEEVKDETPVILLDKSNELVLSVPFCIYNKTCRISSEVVRRPNVFLQVMVWQHDSQLGIIAFDRDLNDVYFVQSSASQQEILCVELEPADVTEMSINMSIFMMSLIYTEKEYDMVTGEEIDVSLRVVEEEKSEDNEDSDDDLWDDDEEKARKAHVREQKAILARAVAAKKALEPPPPETRIQGFLTLQEDIPEENEFPDEGGGEEEEEEEETENVDDGGGDDNYLETGDNYGDDEGSIDFSL